jgi:hypothetical protein
MKPLLMLVFVGRRVGLKFELCEMCESLLSVL